jgi:hypothetical protein
MRTQQETPPAAAPPPARGTDSAPWHEDLAKRLDTLRLRAALEEWPGWTAEDAATAAEAAREIRAIPQALAHGMQEAFVAGREYGHREERLDELNREISLLASLLAQRAWGRSGSREA